MDSNGNLLAHDYEDSILHEPADSEDIIPAAMSYKLTPEEKSLKMKTKKAMERRKKKELAQRLEASTQRPQPKPSALNEIGGGVVAGTGWSWVRVGVREA